MSVEDARKILTLREENYSRGRLKHYRDSRLLDCQEKIRRIEGQMVYDGAGRKGLRASIEIVKNEINQIKEAYRLLKNYHRTTHSSTAHNRFTNARKGVSKGVSDLFGRMRQGISGLAARMYTRRNGNGGAFEGPGSARTRRSTSSASGRASAGTSRAPGREETKGNNEYENAYTRSRRESGHPYGSRQGFSGHQGFSGYTGTRQIFRKKQDEQIDKYLQVLGLPLKSESFTKDEIRKAFRSSSLRTHPNKNPNGAEEFKAVNEANQQLKELLNVGYNYTPPPQGFIPSASPMYTRASPRAASPRPARSSARASSPRSRAASPRSRAASPRASRYSASAASPRAASPKVAGVKEKETHIMRLKKALGVLGLDPNVRHNSEKILHTFLANRDLSEDVDNAFTILYFNPTPEFGPPRTMQMVKAAIKQRKDRYKDYKENV